MTIWRFFQKDNPLSTASKDSKCHFQTRRHYGPILMDSSKTWLIGECLAGHVTGSHTWLFEIIPVINRLLEMQDLGNLKRCCFCCAPLCPRLHAKCSLAGSSERCYPPPPFLHNGNAHTHHILQTCRVWVVFTPPHFTCILKSKWKANWEKNSILIQKKAVTVPRNCSF